MDILAVVLATIALASPTSGHGDGAPSTVCATMIPGHGVVPQVSGAPYTLALSSATYGCGVKNVSVTLAGTGSFRGFLCQARSSMDNSTTVGTLSDDDATLVFKTNCGPGSITHSEKSDKRSAKFLWTPSSENGTVHIICSVVQTKETFWEKAIHAEISYAGPPCRSSAARVTLAFLASVGVLLAYVI